MDFRCQCHGHSNVCDKEGGKNCDCKNNTKSPRCESGQDPKIPCYQLQVIIAHRIITFQDALNNLKDHRLLYNLMYIFKNRSLIIELPGHRDNREFG